MRQKSRRYRKADGGGNQGLTAAATYAAWKSVLPSQSSIALTQAATAIVAPSPGRCIVDHESSSSSDLETPRSCEIIAPKTASGGEFGVISRVSDVSAIEDIGSGAVASHEASTLQLGSAPGHVLNTIGTAAGCPVSNSNYVLSPPPQSDAYQHILQRLQQVCLLYHEWLLFKVCVC
jgi:D-serine deaminase-like pyridoxal phosphate-dependent protein